MSVAFVPQRPRTATGRALRLFRRSIRPAVIALLRALPSPEGCGCASRKQWLIKQVESI